MKMKVIMKASSIPLGSEVTKIKGEKVYIIKDRIRIFSEDGHPRAPQKEIVAEDGAFFLVSGNGDINAVGGKKELVWNTNDEELWSYLDDLQQGVPQ